MRRRQKTSIAVLLAAVLVVVVLTVPSPVRAYDPQGNYQNPVTVTPPIAVPPTPSCSVVLLHAWGFDNELGQGTAYGNYAPPANCPPPLNQDVLN